MAPRQTALEARVGRWRVSARARSGHLWRTWWGLLLSPTFWGVLLPTAAPVKAVSLFIITLARAAVNGSRVGHQSEEDMYNLSELLSKLRLTQELD